MAALPQFPVLQKHKTSNLTVLCHTATPHGVSSPREMGSVVQLPAWYQTNPSALYLTQTFFGKYRGKRPGPLESRGPSPDAQFPAASHYFVMSKSSLLTTGHPTVSRPYKTISLPP